MVTKSFEPARQIELHLRQFNMTLDDGEEVVEVSNAAGQHAKRLQLALRSSSSVCSRCLISARRRSAAWQLGRALFDSTLQLLVECVGLGFW
jgi:hypothetical protein